MKTLSHIGSWLARIGSRLCVRHMWRHDRVRWKEKERERASNHTRFGNSTEIASMVFYWPQSMLPSPVPPPPVKLLCLATPTWQIAWQWQKLFQLNLCANKVKFCATVFVVLLAQKPRKSFNNLATLTNCPSAVIIYGSEWVVLLALPLSLSARSVPPVRN